MANSAFKNFSHISASLRRENIAREALQLARRHFVSDMEAKLAGGLDFGVAEKNSSPIENVPFLVLAPLAEANRDAVIECIIVDLNYDDLFAAEAQKRWIPGGVPSVIAIENGTLSFFARRYELRVAVSLNCAPRRKHTIIEGLLVLYAARDKWQVVPLYLSRRP